MKFEAGQKFKVGNMDCEISGCFPGAQGRQFIWHDNSYQLTLDGIPMDIKEKDLELFMKLGESVKVVDVTKETVEPIAKVEEVATITKRRGRPPRVKEGEHNG